MGREQIIDQLAIRLPATLLPTISTSGLSGLMAPASAHFLASEGELFRNAGDGLHIIFQDRLTKGGVNEGRPA